MDHVQSSGLSPLTLTFVTFDLVSVTFDLDFVTFDCEPMVIIEASTRQGSNVYFN